MTDKKLTILVASHKPDKVYRDEVYTPIHVWTGRVCLTLLGERI